MAPEQVIAPKTTNEKDPGVSGGSAGPQAQQEKKEPLTFRRNEFFITTGTGAAIQERGKRVESPPTESRLPDEITKEGRIFLENYAQRLIQLNQMHPEVFDTPEHLLDKEIYELLTTVRKTANGEVALDIKNNPIRNISTEKIDKFLQEQENWITLINLIEDQAAREAFAIGMTASLIPPGERQNIVKGRKEISRAKRRIFPFRTPSTRPTTLEHIRENVFGLDRKFVMTQSLDAFNAIANNPIEKSYMKAMGIDVDDYEVHGNSLRLKQNRTPETTAQVTRNLLRGIQEKLETRRRFYQALGVPIEDLDATGEQFLYNFFTQGQQEKLETINSLRIMEKFNPNSGGILDRWGQIRTNPCFGRTNCLGGGPLPADAPVFNEGNLDYAGNLMRYMEVRREVMLESIMSYIKDQQDGTKSVDYTQAIDGKIKARTKEGNQESAEKIRRIQEPTARKQALEKEKASLVPEKQKVDNYNTVKNALQEAEVSNIQTRSDNLVRAEDLIIGSTTENLILIEANFKTVSDWGINEQQLRSLSEDQLLFAINAINNRNLTQGWSEAENSDPARRQILINAITEAKARLAESSDPERQARSTAYTQITGWGITVDNLRLSSINDLMNNINNANTANNANGWTQEQNNDPDNIKRLNRAGREARQTDRTILRHSILIEERIRNIDARIKIEQDLIEDPTLDTRIQNERETLEMIKALMGRSQEIYENLSRITLEREKYLNPSSVSLADTTLTNAEKIADLPQGYLEIMDFLFQYKTKPNRADYFSKIYTMLSPEKLADILYRSPGLRLATVVTPISPLTTPPLRDIFNNLNFYVENGLLASVQFIMPINGIINRLRDEAMAM